MPHDKAGIRLHGRAGLSHLLDPAGPIGSVAATALGGACFPVRAILFDKTEATNWALGWHQDRTIVVREHVDVPGFGSWTLKQGLIHVSPPAEILAGMVTLRLHLDPVDEDNAPLLIARGTHRHGAVPEHEIDTTVARAATHACLAERGDVWLYSTLILHASAAARRPARRRVLQIDYAATPLTGGLDFLGV